MDSPTRALTSRARRYAVVVLVVGVAALLHYTSAHAQASDKDPAVQSGLPPAGDTVSRKAEDTAWKQFFPPPDSRFDWIQLKSDEWLKGELKGLYSYKIDFDSDELDLLSFDWEDIKALRTARPQAVRYEDFRRSDGPFIAFGVLTIVGNSATIGSGPGAIRIDRRQIITIAAGAERELDHWSGSLSLGANVRTGNSDLADANISFKAQRRLAISRFVTDYLGNFSRAGGVETSNNHRLNANFDRFANSRTYWRIVYAEYFRDKFQNIERQITLGTGIGYELIRNVKTEWDVSAGLGYLQKRYVSVEMGQDSDNTSPALQLGTHYDTSVTSTLDFLVDLRMQFVDEQNGSYIHHLVGTVSSDLTHNLDLDISLVWDRVNKPQPQADGHVPDKNDFRLIVGVKYEF